MFDYPEIQYPNSAQTLHNFELKNFAMNFRITLNKQFLSIVYTLNYNISKI